MNRGKKLLRISSNVMADSLKQFLPRLDACEDLSRAEAAELLDALL